MAKTTRQGAHTTSKQARAAKRSVCRPPAPAANKSEQITRLLRRPEGASLAEMMKATGWQRHSLRGFMSGAIVKRKGLTIASERAGDERRYRIIEAGAAS